MTRLRPELSLSCPKSGRPWRITPRRQAGRTDRYSAVCPSCGHGLELRPAGPGLELVPPRTIGSTEPHRLG